MEPLLKQLGDLPKRLGALPSRIRWLLFGGIAIVAGVVAMMQLGAGSSTYEYAFTNLSPEDAAEAAGQLKAAKIPFKMEAGGTALSVPSTQVYDARLMLAASGLPRGAGVGFEIFDRSDLGVSEFTQRVNLKRAIEGELARTIGHLAAVRSARVHITLPEKGLYRDDDRNASAAVVLNLQPGRQMADKEIAGVRHLVSSSVPGLLADHVTLVDGHGSVLAGDDASSAKEGNEQRAMERSLEQRIVELLEPAVGSGAVVAKVSATVDSADVETTSDSYDPEASAVRSEHHMNEQMQSDSAGPAGLAGAAANQPLGGGVPGGPGSGARGQTNREDETKNYEISKTVTRTIQRGARLKKLSVAVLLETPSDKPRTEAEMARLTSLAKSAVGFDAQRGDQFELSSSPFFRKEIAPDAKLAFLESPWIMRGARVAGALILLLIVAVALARMKPSSTSQSTALAAIRPGSKLSEAEAALAGVGVIPAGDVGSVAQLPPTDPNVMVRDRARELTRQDPQRAAQILKAWINADSEQRST